MGFNASKYIFKACIGNLFLHFTWETKKAIKGKKSFIRFHEASQKPQKNMHCTKVSKGTGKRDLPAELFFSEEFTLAPFVRARIS